MRDVEGEMKKYYLLVFIVLGLALLTAQERTSEPLRVWEIARKDFTDTWSSRTIMVYKFQVGNKMVCKAVFAYQADAPVSLGDVPCE
jgi:hypothetical protein